MRTYRTILADPPWPYHGKGPPNRTAARGTPFGEVSSKLRYGTMSLDEIKALRPPADHNAHLYLWTTNSFMVQAHEVAAAWGFKVKTIITWTKTKADGTPSMKTGYYYRGATEHLLFCVRGSLRLAQPGRGEPTALLLGRLPHSVKPEESYQMIERQSFGPFLELFARRKRAGWDAWGNEVENDIELC